MEIWLNCILFSFKYIYFYKEREKEREKGGVGVEEQHIDLLPPAVLLPGMEPQTQVHALTENQTGNLLVHYTMPNQWSNPSQGKYNNLLGMKWGSSFKHCFFVPQVFSFVKITVSSCIFFSGFF